MSVQILMSTMGKKEIKDLRLKEKNLSFENDILIINQIYDENNLKIKRQKKIEMYSFKEKGLSKSRNKALELMNNNTQKLCILTDDDVTFSKNFDKKILKAYENHPDADIITFQIEDDFGNKFKKYKKKSYKHNLKTLLGVSSIEITFRKKSIRNILFDENFGLGSNYSTGEEAIFLKECHKKGLVAYFVPETIAIHPLESSGSILDEIGLRAKGAVYFKLFGKYSFFLIIVFILKNMKLIKKEIGIIKSLKIIYNGISEYKKIIDK